MKHLVVAIGCTFAICVHAAPASRLSIEELLEVAKSESLVESMYANLEQNMKEGITKAVGAKQLTPEQQRIVDGLPRHVTGLLREEIGWQILKPEFVQIYSETFEQDDVDALVTFYKSKAGRALIDKMPAVMQRSMALTQSRMQAFYPRIRSELDKAIAELDAAK